MVLLALGLVLFVGTHSFTMARGPRGEVIGRLGEGGYKGLYSVLSLAGMILISVGYSRYRAAGYVPVWDPPIFTRHLALLLNWFGFVFFAAAYLPGRIKTVLKHPMMAGLKVWALAHLLANGDLGSMLLFGGLLAWAVVARISVKRRSVAAAHGGPVAAPAGWRNDAIAVAVGTAAYLAFAIYLHPRLIGVAVWPGQV
ncbi:MAG TPA: NnrU family protein [Beijerinckiaceae bacterium]|jgi:uncharacterized membrane protein